MIKKRITQRDVMRGLLSLHGYDEAKVCAAYAAADQVGDAPRASDMNAMTAEQYAQEVWKDGHRPREPWIPRYCREHGLL